MQSEYLMLLIIIIISLLAKNTTVAIACGLLFTLRLFHAGQALDFIEKNGLSAGIVLLTMGVLAPVATGKINMEQIKQAFLSPLGISAIAAGILVAILGGRGVVLMKTDPLVIAAIIIGTIIGVALFKGIAVGPLIAAGITAVLHKLLTSAGN